MIRDLGASGTSQLTESCAVCVVGGGVAGLVAASRLGAPGRRVIVLESGDRKPHGRYGAFNAVELVGDIYHNVEAGRVRALGGTSNTWGGRIMPLTPHDMGPRDYLGLRGWPIERADLDRFVPEIERLFRLDSSSYEELPLSPMHRMGGGRDLTARWSKWPTFRRRNVAHVLREMVAAKSNPEIWLNATACKFHFDSAAGRLAAIEAVSLSGRRMIVKAEWFIFAAGTFETTRLLLQLDRQTDGRAFSGCEALGRYFNDHLKIEAGRIEPVDGKRTNLAFGYYIGRSTRRALHLETSAAAQREDQAASGYVTVRAEFRPHSIHNYIRNLGKSVQSRRFPGLIPGREIVSDAGSLSRALYWRVRRRQMYLGPALDLFVDARIEQTPNHASRLTLSKQRDALGVPMLQVDWRRTSLDKHTLRSLLLRARRFWSSTLLDATSPIAWSAKPDADDLIERATDTRHPAGTARMGVDPRTSVVNPSLACHAVPNIFVASAAVFPSSGSANPTLTIMQIACRAAESVTALGERLYPSL